MFAWFQLAESGRGTKLWGSTFHAASVSSKEDVLLADAAFMAHLPRSVPANVGRMNTCMDGASQFSQCGSGATSSSITWELVETQILGLILETLNQKLWRWDSGICILRFPGDAGSCTKTAVMCLGCMELGGTEFHSTLIRSECIPSGCTYFFMLQVSLVEMVFTATLN